MNKMHYRNSDYDYEYEAAISNTHYVDVFGRAIDIIEGEDGELYVSLSELKKSGFEVFQAGALPTFGQFKHFDEQFLYQLDMYIKMKLAKFLSVRKLNIDQDTVNNLVKKEINQCTGKTLERSVKMDATGLIKISALGGNSDNSANRSRLSGDFNEGRGYGNRLNQKPRLSMPTVRESITRYNQSEESSNSFPNRSGLQQRYNSDDSLNNYGKPNQRNEFNSGNRYNNNNRYQNSVPQNDEEFRKPARRSYNNARQFEKPPTNIQHNKNIEKFNNDSDTNENVGSFGQDSVSNTKPLRPKSIIRDVKPLTQVSLDRNASEKDEDGTYNVEVKETPIKTEIIEEETNLTNQTINSSGKLQTPKSMLSSKIDSSSLTTVKQVKFADNVKEEKISEPEISMAKGDATASLQSPTRKSVVEVSISDKGIFECTEFINESTFVAFIFPNSCSNQLCELEPITTETKSDPNFKCKVGDFVAVPNASDYVRATILNITDSKYVCALVDYGTVITVEEVRSLPDKFKVIPEFTCLCKADPKILKLIELNATMSVTINSLEKITVESETTGSTFEINVSRWNPFETSTLVAVEKSSKSLELPVTVQPKEVSIKLETNTSETIYKLESPVNKLKDKDIVIITAEQQGSLLLRTKECNTLFKQVNQELSNYKGKTFDKPPVTGQLAVASFNDDLCRVVIQSIKDDKATIEYIDYGNSTDAPTKILMHINEKLAHMGNTLIKISLKNFIGVTFSDRTLRALEEYSAKKEKFTVVDTGNAKEYDLLLGDQSSLSEKLKSLDSLGPPKLTATPKSSTPKQVVAVTPPAPMEAIVRLNDLPPSKFKIGNNEVFCMHTGDIKEGNVSFCLSNEETAETLSQIQEKIAEYTAKPITPYKPQVDEVCLAKFTGDWYRACIVEIDKNDYSVYYIDFGNSSVVTSNDFCKLPKDLAKMEPIASLCILKGVIPEGSESVQEPLLSKMLKELQDNEQYSINVVENVQGYLIITIPSLYDSWKKQGLL